MRLPFGRNRLRFREIGRLAIGLRPSSFIDRTPPEFPFQAIAHGWLESLCVSLQDLGWTPDANLRVDVRYGVDDDDLREQAKQLVGLAPDVVLAMAPPSVIALLKVTRSVPIVF